MPTAEYCSRHCQLLQSRAIALLTSLRGLFESKVFLRGWVESRFQAPLTLRGIAPSLVAPPACQVFYRSAIDCDGVS